LSIAADSVGDIGREGVRPYGLRAR